MIVTFCQFEAHGAQVERGRLPEHLVKLRTGPNPVRKNSYPQVATPRLPPVHGDVRARRLVALSSPLDEICAADRDCEAA
jgi:hypothetical protein